MKEWRTENEDKSQVKWRKKNPTKVKAEQLLQYAVRKGIIKRQPCQECGKKKSVAHHPDYRKVLEVVFLCHQHHRFYHYKGRKQAVK